EGKLCHSSPASCVDEAKSTAPPFTMSTPSAPNIVASSREHARVPVPVLGRVVMLPWCIPDPTLTCPPPTMCEGPVTARSKIKQGVFSSPGCKVTLGTCAEKEPTTFCGGVLLGGRGSP